MSFLVQRQGGSVSSGPTLGEPLTTLQDFDVPDGHLVPGGIYLKEDYPQLGVSASSSPDIGVYNWNTDTFYASYIAAQYAPNGTLCAYGGGYTLVAYYHSGNTYYSVSPDSFESPNNQANASISGGQIRQVVWSDYYEGFLVIDTVSNHTRLIDPDTGAISDLPNTVGDQTGVYRLCPDPLGGLMVAAQYGTAQYRDASGNITGVDGFGDVWTRISAISYFNGKFYFLVGASGLDYQNYDHGDEVVLYSFDPDVDGTTAVREESYGLGGAMRLVVGDTKMFALMASNMGYNASNQSRFRIYVKECFAKRTAYSGAISDYAARAPGYMQNEIYDECSTAIIGDTLMLVLPKVDGAAYDNASPIEVIDVDSDYTVTSTDYGSQSAVIYPSDDRQHFNYLLFGSQNVRIAYQSNLLYSYDPDLQFRFDPKTRVTFKVE